MENKLELTKLTLELIDSLVILANEKTKPMAKSFSMIRDAYLVFVALNSDRTEQDNLVKHIYNKLNYKEISFTFFYNYMNEPIVISR
jgi:hypothetical protein